MKKLVAFALILGLGMFSVVGCTAKAEKKEPENESGGGEDERDAREDAPGSR